jgi:hypothetical protein
MCVCVFSLYTFKQLNRFLNMWQLYEWSTFQLRTLYQGTFWLFQTDAHNYKIIGILKQLKLRQSLEMFRSTQEPSFRT